MDNNWDKIWKRDSVDVLTHGPSTRSRTRHVSRLIMRYMKSGSILDVGCGGGATLAEIYKMKKFSEIWGVDISEVPLRIAREKYPWATFKALDIEHQGLAKKFDMIICLFVLDLVNDDDAALKNISAMLNKNGYLIIVVQHKKEYWNRLDTLRLYRRYEANELEAKCLKYGLKRTEIFSWGWPLYHLYYKVVIKNDEKFNDKEKSRAKTMLVRLISFLLYAVFFLDDLFTPLNRGRQLYAVFQKEIR